VRATSDDDVDFSAASLRRRVQQRSPTTEKKKTTTKKKASRPIGGPGPVGMRDRRVQSAQEPGNELRELLEGSDWGLLGFPSILLRFAAIYVAVGGLGWLLSDNYDTYNELLTIPLAKRVTLAALFGGFASFFSALRLFGAWKYIDARLEDTNLYFEQTGWADGFQLDKPDDTAFRDRLLRDEEVAPRLAVVTRAFYVALLAAALSFAAFLLVWSNTGGPS